MFSVSNLTILFQMFPYSRANAWLFFIFSGRGIVCVCLAKVKPICAGAGKWRGPVCDKKDLSERAVINFLVEIWEGLLKSIHGKEYGWGDIADVMGLRLKSIIVTTRSIGKANSMLIFPFLLTSLNSSFFYF